MKLITITLICLSVFSISSCSSEYQERLSEAKILQEKLIKTQKNINSLGPFAQEEITELNELISFHAKISGNEELFIKELKGN